MWGKIEKGRGSRFKMPTGPFHYFARPTSIYKWGEPHLILFLMNLGTFWPYANHRFGIGDLADRDPRNSVTGHVSHNGGNAVDIYIIDRVAGRERNEGHNRVTYHDQYVDRDKKVFTDKRYDPEKTQMLANFVAWLSLSFPMIEVLYNDPKVQANTTMRPRILTDLDKQRIKKAKGKSYNNIWQHDDHIHCLLSDTSIPGYTTELIKYWVKASGIESLRQFIEEGLKMGHLLRMGSRVQQVDMLQFVLNLHGQSSYAALVEDSIFGAKTRQRVTEFQAASGLSPDGIVGPKTTTALAQEMDVAKLG